MNDRERQDKIGATFTSRTRRTPVGETVHAVVMVNAAPVSHIPRTNRLADRRMRVEAVRASARDALEEIDDILRQHGGRRVTDEVSAVGSIVIETTAAGLAALALSERVKAVLENQPLQLLR